MRARDPGRGDPQDNTGAFLHDFFGRGEMFVRQLIAENARLRSELNDAVPDRSGRPELTPASVIETLLQRVAELEREREDVQGARSGGSPDEEPLRGRIRQLEDENYHIASLHIIGLQFHALRTLGEVIQAITEVLLNFIGIGAFTMFLLDEERQVLFPIAREGGEVDAVGEVALTDPQGGLAQMVQRARPWTRGDPVYADDEAMMYLPLVSGRRFLAVLRLERFLAQKPRFEDNDSSLLSLISEHAGVAIESAWLRAHARVTPFQRQAVEHIVGA